MRSCKEVESILQRAVNDAVFPGVVTAWGPPDSAPNIAYAGKKQAGGENVDPGLLYDLASVSKILCTTSLYMILNAQGLNLDKSLSETGCFKDIPARWKKITIAQLLRHQSGLPSWRPLYLINSLGQDDRKKKVSAAIFSQEAEAKAGEKTIYSDLGFILLGFIIERLSGWPLDEAFSRLISKPLTINKLIFCPKQNNIAPTEQGPRIGGPLNYPGLPALGDVPLGRVHDDNAAFLDGVAGHAGLFGSIDDIWRLASEWAKALLLNSSAVFKKSCLEEFIRPSPSRQDKGRPLGFDMKTSGGVLENSNFSSSSIGHLGYTGTSLWWDIEKNFFWILLSNRVCPSAENLKIIAFRRQLAHFIL